ncbi:hypothetical protein V6N11_064816 [Hibiscus sabdariffa]|uniref:RNase H type-1 domain-containing protein n=1 Tax=Hibiscus sabdariffa TaxID=183260 RepID=A0ABR2SI51_9ROSI
MGPMAGGGGDLVGWKGSVDLRFSVKSAYLVRTGISVASPEGRNSIAFDTPMEDNRPILDQCRHLWDIASRALQRVNGAVIGSISSGSHGRLLTLAHIHELLRQNWDVELRYSCRDSNAAVGAMARLARIGDFDQVDFVAPPASLHPLLLRDSLHASTPNYWLQITQ